MEIVFLFFVAIIFFAAISAGTRQQSRPVRRNYSEGFKNHFSSLPDDHQTDFMNGLDEIQRLQFMQFLNNEINQVPDGVIDNFNDWAQDENKNVDTFNTDSYIQGDSFPPSYDGTSDSSNNYDDNIYNDCNYRTDDSSTDFGSSSDWGSSTDYSSSSDSSTYSDSSSSSGSSDF